MDDNEVIGFSPDSLPEELYGVLCRFTRIPNYEAVLPFVVAYDLCPVLGLRSFMLLFCKGPSGSGKSTIGEILQRLNPRIYGDNSYLQSSDTAKGWEQNIPAYRIDHNGEPRAFPLVFIDDLMPGTFTGPGGDLKLALLKQMVNCNGQIRRGGLDGKPLTIEVYTKTVTGSIHDLPQIEGLQELERRSIVITHKNITEWTEDEHTTYTRENELENHGDYRFAPDYDEVRHIWFNENAGRIREHRKQVKLFLKTCDLIPVNKREFVYPLIAMSLSCGFFKTPLEACIKFSEAFLTSRNQSTETQLQILVKQWLFSDMSPYKSRIALAKDMEGRISVDIPYEDVSRFIKRKISTMELSQRECSRAEIVAAMGLLGFKITSEDGDTIFTYRPEITYNE